jgi:hypothetical protein
MKQVQRARRPSIELLRIRAPAFLASDVNGCGLHRKLSEPFLDLGLKGRQDKLQCSQRDA